MSSRRKLATKRKLVTPKGKAKRKATWTVEDIPSLVIPKKQVKLKQVDLSTPLHLLVSSKSHHETTGNTNTSNKDVETFENEIWSDEENNANNQCKTSVTGSYLVNTENDDVRDDDEDTRPNNDTLRDVSILNAYDSPMLTPQSNGTPYVDMQSNANITISSVSEYSKEYQRSSVSDYGIYNENQRSSVNDYENDKKTQRSSISDSENENHSDGYQTDSFHGSIENTEKAINITDLMNGGNTLWDEVLPRYKQVGTLSKKHRKAVMEAIIQFALVKNIFLNYDLMSSIFSQILKIFPTEIRSNYVIKIGGKTYGKFYNLYHRKRGEYMKDQKEREMPEVLLEPTESVALLKSDDLADNVYIEKWKETIEYRQKKVLKYDSFDDYLNEWPIIGKQLGSLLINMDFKTIYGKRMLTSYNWNSFFSNNWAYFTKNITRVGARFCKKVSKLKESPGKDAALSMILHYLLPPSYGAFKWKPTYVDSQDTFLKFIKDESIEDEVQKRNEVCQTRGIKWHPYIIGQGPSKRKIKHFYVVIHNTKIKVEDFVSRLDLCMKIFILLKIPYPPESRAVWIVVNKLFYNIDVDAVMKLRYLEFLNEMN